MRITLLYFLMQSSLVSSSFYNEPFEYLYQTVSSPPLVPAPPYSLANQYPPSPRSPRPPPRPPTPPPRPPRPPSPPPRPKSPPPRPPRPLPPHPSPRPPPSPADNAGLEGGGCYDVKDTFSAHNVYRQWHQVKPLTWNTTLAKSSAEYADTLSQNCRLKHSDDAWAGKFGENLYLVLGYPKPDIKCRVAIDVWYNEMSRYNFTTRNAFNDNWPKGVGHFSQMVWKDTQLIGCGVSIRDMPLPGLPQVLGRCKVIVCRYFRPGNYASDSLFYANVLPKV